MARRIRDHDWSATPLGPVEGWPAPLKAALGICLNSSYPTAVYWGPELRLLYNDAWRPVADDRHPLALGRPAAEVWPDIWHVVGDQFAHVVATGKGFSTFDQMLPMRRGASVVETYWDYSITPIFDERGAIAGVFNQGVETTDRVQTTRAQKFLLGFGDLLRDGAGPDVDPDAVLASALEAIGGHLAAARVGYAEVDHSDSTCLVLGDWRGAGLESLAGRRYELDRYGEQARGELLSGRVVAVADVRTEERLGGGPAEAFGAIGVVANLLVPITREGRTFAFLFVNDDRPRRWTQREIETAQEAADRLQLALSEARATARLRESELRSAAIFGQAAVGMAEVSLDGRFLRTNDAMKRLLGRSAEELASATVEQVTHPDDRAESTRRMAEASATGQSFEFEKRYLRPDGSLVWAVTNVTRLVDERGRPSSFLAVAADISERREAERVRALLLAELNHRVRNNLATVQAIARQTRRTVRDPAAFEQVFDARLMALSSAHDLLTREAWSSASLDEIVRLVLAPYASERPDRIAISGAGVRLSPNAAVTMAMTLHELAANAARFGALSVSEGRVDAAWSIDRENEIVAVEWRETGGPAVSPPTRRGYGSRLIERGVAQELGGEARLDFAAEGVIFTFRTPFSEKVAPQ
ncbi:HWE histidine kinase domain-containing protein [Methylopila henanensis]|uniref:Blue-light-activated histidine kinase n=1 Tax=Methylopila henanensis TaxID=873516 RepID=A0ABW4KCG4_9HYPH